MATAPRRATKVPGATQPAETTTAQNAEDALNEILGAPEPAKADAADTAADLKQTEAEADPVPAETTTAAEVSETELAEYEEFRKWRAMKAAAVPVQKAPVAAVSISASPADSYRDVLTEAGWIREKA